MSLKSLPVGDEGVSVAPGQVRFWIGTDGQLYIRENQGGLVFVVGEAGGDSGGGSVSDAPSDGQLYGRLNSAWAPVPSVGDWVNIPVTGNGVTDDGLSRYRMEGDVCRVQLGALKGGGNETPQLGGLPKCLHQYETFFGSGTDMTSFAHCVLSIVIANDGSQGTIQIVDWANATNQQLFNATGCEFTYATGA